MNALKLFLPFAVMVGTSQAAVIASGLRDIVITSSFTGVYLDIDAGGLVAVEGAGWDINPFFGGEGIASSPSFSPVAASATLDAPLLNLAFGQTVNSASVFASTYPGGFSGSSSHVGNGVGQFASGSEGYLGFRFAANNTSSPLLYGWMRVVLANDGSTGLIRDWAYENTGSSITVGAVPEPSVFCPIVLGVFGLVLRRKRVVHS